jgi:hypothetical protein
VALVGAAVLIRDLWLLGTGAVGVLITAPIVVDRFFQGQLAAPLALLGAGALLVVLGIFIARRRRSTADRPRAATVRPWLAVTLMGAVILAVTPAVVAVGS